MNKGDAGYVLLNIKVNGIPMTEDYADDIEVTFEGDHRLIKKTLKEGHISWNVSNQCYQLFLSQDDTFNMNIGNNSWQIRILKGDSVISSRLGTLIIGTNISTDVLK